MNPLSINNDIIFHLVELKQGEAYTIPGNEIITVISGKVSDRIKGTLHSFESSIYYSGNIIAKEKSLLSVVIIRDKDILLNKINVDGVFGDYCRSHWKQLKKLYDVDGFEKVDLFRGDQMEYESAGKQYKLNLWFCGKNVDCLFHNQHNFIEVHTNLAGDGYMQKSINGTEEGLIETVGLLPGNSHRTFNIQGELEQNGNPKYPFHRWLGGTTGNIWLVIEEY